MPRDLRPLFDPTSVAILGASDDPAKWGNWLARGALRGAGNTHAGLIVQIVGYWIIGLPIGSWLGFHLHHGALGLWIGLCACLIVAGISLTTVWSRTTRSLSQKSLVP